MRVLIVSLTLFGAVATAHADWASSQVNVNELPAQCRWTIPQYSGAPMRLQWSSVTSAANCMASVRLDSVHVAPTEASARMLEQNAAPSLALLDKVIANGDAEAQIIAQHAKGDILGGIAVRLSDAVGPAESLVGAAAQTFQNRVDLAYNLGEPSRAKAAVAFREVGRLAATTDGRRVENNPVVAYAVRASITATTKVIARR